MPRYRLLIDNPVLAKTALDDMVRKARMPARDHRPARGDIWTKAESECPLENLNCRNCGDPAFAATCAADGHCPQCGTAHGIAPDSVLAQKGLRLEEDTN